MKDQVLSIQQMLSLRELGIDISKASMLWVYKVESGYYRLFINKEDKDDLSSDKIPTFTLQDMINIMPVSIKRDGRKGELFLSHKDISYFGFDNSGRIVYLVGYKMCDNESVLSIAMDMLIWLKENKYI